MAFSFLCAWQVGCWFLEDLRLSKKVFLWSCSYLKLLDHGWSSVCI